MKSVEINCGENELRICMYYDGKDDVTRYDIYDSKGTGDIGCDTGVKPDRVRLVHRG